ncbi:hypothetical protein [Flavobacterium sp. KBS0721]|uniref:hypothetical protein n=1 Tax=Flavobacterium sp. KBS0721 TaxID=1179672 RepID=UPI00098F0B14|nr:hypothetical protein [Flavobacterium sp. KBS0721]QDW20760.1 hypothetical protein B0M43_0011775 [Flavobacterium sp. KBS0721]
MESLKFILKWTNENSGFVSVLLFVITLLIAWISGFFKMLVSKPKFKIEIIDQCSFCCVFDLNTKHNDLPVHKSAFVIYIQITNVGKAPSSIGKIKLGYYKSDFTHKFLSKRNWIEETISKEDFKFAFENSENIKIFPFLKQRNQLMPNESETYLPIGKQKNGIIYFEEQEAFGSWMPRENENEKTTDIKLVIEDMFGGKHRKKIKLNLIEPKDALKYNSYFGQTYKEYFANK